MKRMILLFALFFLAWISLNAQYNERDILSQQAYQLLARRQYADAEQLFKQIMEKFPDDQNTIVQLLQIYYQTSQLPKAEALLSEKQRVLSQSLFSEQSILLLIHKALPEDAMELSRRYLSVSGNDPNKYRLIASYFEMRGFYEQVLKLYDDARKRFNNPDLFVMETANACLYYRLFPRATSEYLRFLELNPGNLFFITNQIKTIVNEDPTMVGVIAAKAQSSGDPVLWELYAGILVEQKLYSQAIDAYRKLPWNRLYRFAEDQYSALRDEIADLAYTMLDSTSTDPGMRADYKLRRAQIAYRNGKSGIAQAILDSLFADPTLLSPSIRNRIQANYVGRKLMTDILIGNGASPDSVLALMNQTRSFARNRQEIQETELLIGRYFLLIGDHPKADKQFSLVNDPSLAENVAFLRFLETLMQGKVSLADSLMNEYIIKYPASGFTNDAIYLMMLVYGLSETGREAFFDAYRKFALRDIHAPMLLEAIFRENGDEELRLLAIEWAISLGDPQTALQLLDYAWQDEIAIEYSALIRLNLSSDMAYEQRYAREFLKTNPNSIFSPRMRQVISKISYGRPNL